jgi:hypothetical protein
VLLLRLPILGNKMTWIKFCATRAVYATLNGLKTVHDRMVFTRRTGPWNYLCRIMARQGKQTEVSLGYVAVRKAANVQGYMLA